MIIKDSGCKFLHVADRKGFSVAVYLGIIVMLHVPVSSGMQQALHDSLKFLGR